MEFILCAAIWYKNYPELPSSYIVNGTNKGIVLCGHRHTHIIGQCLGLTGKRQSQMGQYEQGFITNKNRFVDRIEAAKIAIWAGQIKKLKYCDTKLYSEDLY